LTAAVLGSLDGTFEARMALANTYARCSRDVAIAANFAGGDTGATVGQRRYSTL
jgi:hypothetical protein